MGYKEVGLVAGSRLLEHDLEGLYQVQGPLLWFLPCFLLPGAMS